jgi:hypothetical protein
VRSFSSKDVVVVAEGVRIAGIGALIRIASQNAAIGCFKVSKWTDSKKASTLIVEYLVSRARKTSYTFVSCIPGRDNQPSPDILEKFGFAIQETRAVFYGRIAEPEAGECNLITETDEALDVIRSNSIKGITTHYRPVIPTSESLKYALVSGALVSNVSSERTSLAFVFESQCLQRTDSHFYMIPNYLLRKENSNSLVRIGEITLLTESSLRNVFPSCLKWLKDRGVEHANVYSSLSDSLGSEIMSLGFNPLARQAVWFAHFKGPLDGFLDTDA